MRQTLLAALRSTGPSIFTLQSRSDLSDAPGVGFSIGVADLALVGHAHIHRFHGTDGIGSEGIEDVKDQHREAAVADQRFSHGQQPGEKIKSARENYHLLVL